MKDLAYLLEKQTIEIPETENPDELTQDLATQASNVLGYTKLRTAVNNKTRALARVIQDIGLETFTPESVKSYQAAVIQEKRRETLAAMSPARRFIAKRSNWFFLFCLLSFAACSLFVRPCLDFHQYISAAILFLMSLASMCSFCTFLNLQIPTYVWRRIHLDGRYNEEVEKFALARAIEIKKALPSAQIFVEECAEVKDPFLVAVNGDEEYHFAVYDEPKFEANLN